MDSIQQIRTLLEVYGYTSQEIGYSTEDMEKVETHLQQKMPPLLKAFYLHCGKTLLFQNKNGFNFNLATPTQLGFESYPDDPDFAEPHVILFTDGIENGYDQSIIIKKSQFQRLDPECESWMIDSKHNTTLLSETLVGLTIHNLAMEMPQEARFHLVPQMEELIYQKVIHHYPEIIPDIFGKKGLLIKDSGTIKAKNPTVLLQALKKLGLEKFQLKIELYFDENTAFNPELLKDFVRSEVNIYITNYQQASLEELLVFLKENNNLLSKKEAFDFTVEATPTSWKVDDPFIQEARRKRRRQEIAQLMHHHLENIDTQQEITLPLKEFLHLYQSMQEVNRFLEDKTFYPNLYDVETFLGTQEVGALSEMRQSLENIKPYLPKKTTQELPFYPYYFQKINDIHDATYGVQDIETFQEFLVKEMQSFEAQIEKEIEERQLDKGSASKLTAQMFLEGLVENSSFEEENEFHESLPKNQASWRNFAEIIDKTVINLIYHKLRQLDNESTS